MILHIDMDAFYASVEQLDNPRLKGQCVIVGGTSGRGVVSAASYEARAYGVHSAMPVFQARQKCPEGIFIPPRMRRYQEISAQVMTILSTVSPLMEPVSIDEAFIDVSGCERTQGTAETIARRLKREIHEHVRLTCSVGAAPLRFLAKIASDMDKPDGMTIIHPREVTNFISTLPIQKVPGVGKKALQSLNEIDITCLGQVNRVSKQTLERRLGKFGLRLIELASGNDKTPVTPARERKSISSECTLAKDTRNIDQLKKIILGQSQTVAGGLRKKSFRARTITLKIKHLDFKQFTRSLTLATPTQSSEIVYQTAVRLLERYHLKHEIRLIGVGASGLISAHAPLQTDLFDSKESFQDHNWEKVDKALDGISKKFGHKMVQRGTLTDSTEETKKP